MTAAAPSVEPFRSIQHQVVAQFHHRTTICEFEGQWQSPAGVRIDEVEKLPVIIRQPQWVRFADRYFHIEKEGLYRFWDWGKVRFESPQAMPETVDAKQNYSCVIYFKDDVLTLFGALATLQYHGERHDKWPFDKQLTWLKTGTLSLQCGTSSQFYCTLLPQLGYQARLLSLVRIEGPLSSWNNGHILIEFFWPKFNKWVMADINGHRVFVKNGIYLNAGEVREILESGGEYDFEPLTAPAVGLVDVSYGMLGEFPGTSYSEPGFADDAKIKAALKPLLVMPLLAQDGAAYFYHDDPVVQDRVHRANKWAKQTTKADWYHRFYTPFTGH